MPRAPSPLDAFFHPQDPLDVVRAVAALDTLSSGAVVKPYVLCSQTGRPEGGGPWCERIFGPMESGRCTCGFLGGPRGRPPAPDGERCPKCGVEATSSAVRAERWAHVETPIPLLHPVLAGHAGRVLGLPAEDVLAVARFRGFFADGRIERADDPFALAEHRDACGPEALQARLRAAAAGRLMVEGPSPEAYLIRRLPVPPPGDRPPVRMPGGHDLPGEIDRRWSELVLRATRFGRLSELGAPPPVLVGEGQHLVAAFEAVVTGRAPDLAREDDEGVRVQAPSEDLAGYLEPRDPLDPLGAAFAGEDGILIDFPYACVHLGEGGEVRDAFPTLGARLAAVSADGRHALFSGLGGLSVRDLREKRWRQDLPDDLPTASLVEDHEQAFLADPRRGTYQRLLEVADYPALQALSPDGRFLWVEDKERGGGVYEVDRGLLVLLPAVGAPEAPPLLEREGTLEEDTEHPEPPIEAATAAVVLTAHDRFRLAAGGLVTEDGEVILRLAAPSPVVAFSRDGGALLVVRRDVASIVDLDPPALRRAYRLDDLHPALRLDGVPGRVRVKEG